MLPPIRKFAAQNWLIAPVAGAVNPLPVAPGADHPPLGGLEVSTDPGASGPTAGSQRWLLILSGVAMLDFQGDSGAQWRRETVHLSPTVEPALDHAIGRHDVPTPPGVQGRDFSRTFQAEQWAPFVGLSSVFDKNQAVNAGFAVDTWRPDGFGELREATSSTILRNLWRGILVDVAVRDSDAIIHRLSYSISLIGRIVFTIPF